MISLNQFRIERDVQDIQLEINNLKNTCAMVKVHELNKADKIDMLKLKRTMEAEYLKNEKF